MERCRCNPEEIIGGHRPDCTLNEELAQVNKPLPPPRKPFEEMTRDEMILAHTALRHSIAEFVAGLHEAQTAIESAAVYLQAGFKSYPPYTLHETQHDTHYEIEDDFISKAQAALNAARCNK